MYVSEDGLNFHKYSHSAISVIDCASPQDRDFCLLHPGDPLFQTFSGETLRYKGNTPLYPFFINECAYYEKGIALSLARKRRVMIPAIRVQTEQEQQANQQGFASEEEWGWTFKTPNLMRLMYKYISSLIYWNDSSCLEPTFACLHSYTIFKWTIINCFSSQQENEQHIHCRFTKAQSYNDICFYIYATVDSEIN